MEITDAHAHVSTVWYEPMASLVSAMDRSGVASALLVQIMGLYDNTYILDCARSMPERFLPVVLIDHRLHDAPRTLEVHVRQGATGVRLTPSSRSLGADPYAIWRTAGHLGIPVSCPGETREFVSTAFSRLVQELPEVVIVIEHLGGSNVPSRGMPRDRAFALARFPNVHLKLPGAGELVRRKDELDGPDPFVESPIPLVRAALEAFGPDRVMWGSDFPVVMGREGYANALGSALGACDFLSETDRANVFGGVARRLFRRHSEP